MTPGVNLIKPIVDSTRELEPLDDEHPLQTTAFLGCCRLFLPVLDALGVALKPAKADVGGNVDRLKKKEKDFQNVRAFGLRVLFCVATTTTTRRRASVFALVRTDPHRLSLSLSVAQLFDILLDEKKSNSFAANTSCSKALLWLKRFLEFVVVLVSKLAENQRTETKEAASYAYAEKLKPFHGWVSSSAFSVVLQFPPARKGFVESLGGEKVLETDGKELVEKFGPVLKHIDEFLTKEDLNDPSKV